MRWSERLWRLRECWRKLGALAGKGVGERLDYTCDLVMEAWVDKGGIGSMAEEAAAIERSALASPYFRGVPSTYHGPDGAPRIGPSPLFAALDEAFVVSPEDLVKQAGTVVKMPLPPASDEGLP